MGDGRRATARWRQRVGHEVFARRASVYRRGTRAKAANVRRPVVTQAKESTIYMYYHFYTPEGAQFSNTVGHGLLDHRHPAGARGGGGSWMRARPPTPAAPQPSHRYSGTTNHSPPTIATPTRAGGVGKQLRGGNPHGPQGTFRTPNGEGVYLTAHIDAPSLRRAHTPHHTDPIFFSAHGMVQRGFI